MRWKARVFDALKVLFGGIGAAIVVLLIQNAMEPNVELERAKNLAFEKNCGQLSEPREIAKCSLEIARKVEGATLSVLEFETIGIKNTEKIKESINSGNIDDAWKKIHKEIRQYERSFFNHWIDDDGNCLNTRHEKLLETSLKKPKLDAAGCRVVEGLWRDPYTGLEFTNPRKLDMDHVVPLRVAWESGAYLWTGEERTAFANHSKNLIVTSSQANRTKGSAPPNRWLPPNQDYICEYVKLWSSIKLSWGLSAQDAEKRAIWGAIEAHCN